MHFDDQTKSLLAAIVDDTATGDATAAELLLATIDALDTVDQFASNMDVRMHLHRSYRAWASSSPSARQFRNVHLVKAIQQVALGSFTSVERASSEGLLRVAPLAVAFSGDPGRAFQLGAEAVAMFDAEFNTFLSAGVLSLLIARTAAGVELEEALEDAVTFIRPVDWCGEVSNMLSGLLEGDHGDRGHGATCNDLRAGILSVMATTQAAKQSDQVRTPAPSRNANVIGQHLALVRQSYGAEERARSHHQTYRERQRQRSRP